MSSPIVESLAPSIEGSDNLFDAIATGINEQVLSLS